MATYVKFEQFVEDLTKAVHDLTAGTGDQLVIALTAAANAPNAATDAVLADLTEISYTNLSSRNVTIASNSQTSGTDNIVLTDLVLTASGAVGPFRYVILYNDTPSSPADPLIAYWDYGSEVTLANGETFTCDFASPTITLA